MSKTRTIGMMLICLVLGIFIGMGIKTLTANMELMIESATYEKLPRRNFVIIIEKSQREELFNQFRKFADKGRFAIRIAPITPSGEDFSIEMWREDIKVFGANPFDPGEFRIGFYDTDGTYPFPATEGELDNLATDLKSFIDEIPNVTITEEK